MQLETHMILHLSSISKEGAGPSHGPQSHQRDYDLENPCLLNAIVYSSSECCWTELSPTMAKHRARESDGAHLSTKVTSAKQAPDSVTKS